MRRILLTGLAILWCAAIVRAQGAGDVLGMHNLGPGSKSPITGSRTDSCSYCHAPHSATNVGLWNQKLTTQTYTMYKSNTEKNTGIQPKLASASNMCLSCHDGTVAVGDTVAYGKVTTVGVMNDADIFKSQMQTQHPFSLAPPLKDNVHLVSTLASNGKTGDTTGAVKLINGSVECTSCHNPHSQAKDTVSQNFLVKDSSGGQLCLSCHDPSRTVSAQANPLADWGSSAHATAANKIQAAAHVGSYATVGSDACISCHTPHNAGSGARLLRAQDEQTCVTCHSAPTNVDMPPTQNVLGEYQGGKGGHPFPTSSNPHDATEDALLNNNRHATCVDCQGPRPPQDDDVRRLPQRAQCAAGGRLTRRSGDSGVAEECERHQCHRWHQRAGDGGEPVRKLPALPRHKRRQGDAAGVWVFPGQGGFGRRSTQPHSAVRGGFSFKPPGDAPAEQPPAASQSAAQHDEPGWCEGRASHGPADLLQRLP